MTYLKCLYKYFLFSVALIIGMTSASYSLDIPKLTRRVTDLAGVLSPSQADDIELRLKQFEDSTSTQFVVILISSLEGESIEDVTLRIAELNKIGQKGKNNGLIFLAAIQDKKMRFEVGYGLESTVTDAITSVIREEIIKPKFHEGNYYQGILDGMTAAMQATRGEFKAESKSHDDSTFTGIFIVIFFIAVFFILSSFFKRSGRGGHGLWISSGTGWYSGSGGGSDSSSGSFDSFSGGGGDFGGGGSSGDW